MKNDLDDLCKAITKIYFEILPCDYSVTDLGHIVYSSPIGQGRNQKVFQVVIKDKLPSRVYIKYIIDGETFIENIQGPIDFTDKTQEYIFNKIKKIYKTMEILS